MKYISALICLCLVAIASAESGYFIPKAYYTIDSNGARSELSLISPNIQRKIYHRLKRAANGGPIFVHPEESLERSKRAAQVISSSSSSSSSTSGGGPVVFHQTSSNYVGGSPVYSGSSGGLNSRLGEDEPYYSNGGTGTLTQTSGIIHNGQVYSNTYQQRLRKWSGQQWLSRQIMKDKTDTSAFYFGESQKLSNSHKIITKR